MVNTQLLDERIKASGIKITFLCEKLGISREAFYKKKANSYPFRVSEIYVIADILRLTSAEEQTIFFANQLER